MRMWVCSTMPSSQPISRCLPRLSTRSITAPSAGAMPLSAATSKPVMTFSSSAARNARGGPVDGVALRHDVEASRLAGSHSATSAAIALGEAHPFAVGGRHGGSDGDRLAVDLADLQGADPAVLDQAGEGVGPARVLRRRAGKVTRCGPDDRARRAARRRRSTTSAPAARAGRPGESGQASAAP